MIQFICENILFLLTLLGAVVSFLSTFVGLISKKKPVVVLSFLAVLGFVLGISYQVSSYNKTKEEDRREAARKQIEAAATRARDNIIKEINFTVGQTKITADKTKITVDWIARKFSQLTLQQTAAELVTVKAGIGREFDETIAFAKGSPKIWRHYASWLESLNQTQGEPSLSLTLNARHHYNTGLLLAYILTSDITRSELEGIIRQKSKWHTFTAEMLYLQAFGQNSKHIKWILFYDGNRKGPVAYADAKLFAQELMAYHRLEQYEKVEQVLNSTSHKAITALSDVFSSIKTDISKDEDPEKLVKVMIEKQRSEIIATADEKIYVARLERMINLAASRKRN